MPWTPYDNRGNLRVLKSEEDTRRALFAIWLNRHPAYKAAAEDHGLIDALSQLWSDCWHEAALDNVRRHDEAGLHLMALLQTLQEDIARLEEDRQRRAIEAEAELGSPAWADGYPSALGQRGVTSEDPAEETLEELPF